MSRHVRTVRGGVHWGWIVGIGCFVVLLGLGALIALVAAPFARQMREQMEAYEPMDQWTDQMETIAAALKSYRADHDGKFPVTLEEMIPGYLANEKPLTFRGSEEMGGNQQAVYVAPPKDAPDDFLVVWVNTSMPFGRVSGGLMQFAIEKDGDVVSLVRTPARYHRGRGDPDAPPFD